MGLAMLITPERQIEGVDCSVDGKAIGHISDASLDRWARELDIPCLLDFISHAPTELDDLLAEYDEDWREFETTEPSIEVQAPVLEQWFPASLGLAAVRPLLEYVREHQLRIPNAAAVIQDLNDFAHVLEQLNSHKVGFHFSIDF